MGVRDGTSDRDDTGDTAWVLGAAALVLFMTPGLALFYGGLVRSKNVLGTMMQSVAAIAIVSVVWLLAGYTLAFGPDVGGVIGGLAHLGSAVSARCRTPWRRPFRTRRSRRSS